MTHCLLSVIWHRVDGLLFLENNNPSVHSFGAPKETCGFCSFPYNKNCGIPNILEIQCAYYLLIYFEI